MLTSLVTSIGGQNYILISREDTMWTAYISDCSSHKVIAALEFKADGYMTALYTAKQLCANYHNAYVSRVTK